ncbi:MAG TPA: hypothetical protein PKK27_05620 [Methanothrix soehngenii]|nr:hypothetical protein [Methanothrix soehngenii]
MIMIGVNSMEILHLVRSKTSHSQDELIARAARSWDPEFPGRMELPRKYAAVCRETIVLAKSKQKDPKEVLPEVCRIRGIDESEAIEALDALALSIDEETYPSRRKQGMQAAITSKTKDLLARLR